MQVPLQIAFEHVGHSDPLETAVRKEAQRLERFCDRITSARVVIGRPQHRHHKGDTYSVRIHIAMPGGKHVDVTRDPAATGRHEDAHVTIRDAFDATGRQVQDEVRRMGGAVKTHETPPHGTVAALLPAQDHGFICRRGRARDLLPPQQRGSRSGRRCGSRKGPAIRDRRRPRSARSASTT